MPAGIIACFRPLTDASLFLILYGAAAVYFSGVMVRDSAFHTCAPLVSSFCNEDCQHLRNNAAAGCLECPWTCSNENTDPWEAALCDRCG